MNECTPCRLQINNSNDSYSIYEGSDFIPLPGIDFIPLGGTCDLFRDTTQKVDCIIEVKEKPPSGMLHIHQGVVAVQ